MASAVLSFALRCSFFFFLNFIAILWINNTFSICTDENKVSEWPSHLFRAKLNSGLLLPNPLLLKIKFRSILYPSFYPVVRGWMSFKWYHIPTLNQRENKSQNRNSSHGDGSLWSSLLGHRMRLCLVRRGRDGLGLVSVGVKNLQQLVLFCILGSWS